MPACERRIVFTDGCFDILHPGHLHLFRECWKHGNWLVVGVNSDASVRTLKGPCRPVNDEESRANMVSAIAGVDRVIIFDSITPLDCIRYVRPHVLVKGDDWRARGVVGRELVESHGGIVAFASPLRGHSTSRVIERARRTT